MKHSIQIMSFDDFYNYLYNSDYDKFRITVDDLKVRLKYFNISNSYWSDDFYIFKIIDGKIVGLLEYCKVKNGEKTFDGQRHFISYITVDPEYQNLGISKELIQNWKDSLVDLTFGEIGISSFTEQGFNYCRPVLEKTGLRLQMKREITY